MEDVVSLCGDETERLGLWRLMVKELQTVQDRRIELVVHPVTNAEHWMGIDVDRLEELISLAASVVEAGITAGVEVGLTMSGSLPGSPYGYCHQPATGQPVLAEYLTALSWLQPSGAARQLLADRMAEISRRVTTASVVILVCALWEPAVEPLFRSWRARGISLVVITNGDLDARADQFAADIFHWREGKLGHG